MRRIKKDEERKVKLTVTISPEINNQLKDLTNKSKYSLFRKYIIMFH